MISFNHRDPGTAAERWEPTAAAAEPLILPAAGSRVVVLAAHPDDESLGAGGLIAAVARAGCPVEVIVATDGEASHLDSPTHAPARLAQLRRAEVAAAMQALAPLARLRFLGLPDGELAERGHQLDALLRKHIATLHWLVAPWRSDHHPDHEAVSQAAQRLVRQHPGARLLEYPIWLWHWADPATAQWPGRLLRLDLDPDVAATKVTALACHRSQTEPLSDRPGDEPILPPAITAHFARPAELFVEAGAVPAASGDYFDRLYRKSEDPWHLADRFYEQRKRDLVLASLPRPRFRRGLEPGCSIGLLTELLAGRCDQLVAMDVAEQALAQTRLRVPEVDLRSGAIPADWPAGSFDLIVLSEVGYYCLDLDELRWRVEESLDSDGILVACHWRHRADDHPHTAAAVHSALGSGLRVVAEHVETDFLLHVWSRTGHSVAREAGIVS